MFLEAMTWMDVERYLTGDDRIVVITGACEQHGYVSLLSDILAPMAIATAAIEQEPVLVAGVAGAFVARDLLLFLLFYEVVVIPMYILIVVWGSTKRVTKEYAGMKLTIYLLIGSAFLLVSLIYFILCYLLFAVIMAGAGSIGATARENQQLSVIFTLSAVVPIVTIPIWLDLGRAASLT